MLSLRKRGPVWHVRGTVKEGGRTQLIREQSTRCTEERAARNFASNLEARVKAELLLGISQKAARHAPSFPDALIATVKKRRPKAYDAYRYERLLDELGDKTLDQISVDQWNRFVANRLPDGSPNTQARYLDLLRNVFTDSGWPWPKDEDGNSLIRRPYKRVELSAWLPIHQADALLDCYNPNVYSVAVLARFQGARLQEVLQLQRAHVDLVKRTAFIDTSKNGESRWINLHPRSVAVLEILLNHKREPFLFADGTVNDPVFVSRLGTPWPDLRGQGGNPLKKAHAGACARAGVTGFRWHDWRHHWATWFVREGGDLISLMKEGGWRELSMVQRYAAGDMDHRAKQISKMK